MLMNAVSLKLRLGYQSLRAKALSCHDCHGCGCNKVKSVYLCVWTCTGFNSFCFATCCCAPCFALNAGTYGIWIPFSFHRFTARRASRLEPTMCKHETVQHSITNSTIHTSSRCTIPTSLTIPSIDHLRLASLCLQGVQSVLLLVIGLGEEIQPGELTRWVDF